MTFCFSEGIQLQSSKFAGPNCQRTQNFRVRYTLYKKVLNIQKYPSFSTLLQHHFLGCSDFFKLSKYRSTSISILLTRVLNKSNLSIWILRVHAFPLCKHLTEVLKQTCTIVHYLAIYAWHAIQSRFHVFRLREP